MSVFDRKRPKPPVPGWLKAAMIGFLALAAYNAYRGEQSPQSDAPSIEKYPTLKQFVSLDRWKTHLDPDSGKEIQVSEISPGQGDYAACGQHVTLEARYLDVQGDQILPKDFALPKHPVSFTIGDGSVHELFDRGVRGMRQGEVRHLAAGARFIIPDAPLRTPPYLFELTLKTLQPYLADEAAYEATFIHTSSGPPALCGDTVLVQINAPGDATKAPLELTLGQAQQGHGIDRALIGMRPNARKRVTIPKAYLAATTSKKEKWIVEVMRLPYKKLNKTKINIKESLDEPNRQSPESD